MPGQAGNPLAVQKLDKTAWHVCGPHGGAEIEYEIFADQSGPFGAQLNAQHAFFNLAEILMYPVDGRSFSACELASPIFLAAGRIATALTARSGSGFPAQNYDHLVDSPVEIGAFQECDFDEGGGHYRVVVDADPSDYDMQKHRRHAPQPGCCRHQLDERPALSNLSVHLPFSARPPEAAAWSMPTRPPLM